MKNSIGILGMLILMGIHGFVIAQQKVKSEPITTEIGIQYNMQSSILKEERKLFVRLPNNYQESKVNYPVIYVLDGDNHFEHASIAASILEENDRMPESIIVAIPNNQGTRGRDLARERDRFKQYIQEEVIPFIEENYRTTKHKTLFGHSMAGAFVLNYLATRPSLFENYIVASPVIQIFNSELLVQFDELFKQKNTLDKSLYFTLTGVEAEGQAATDALNKFVERLKKDAPKEFAWEYDFIENQVHMTTPYLTMYKGFTAVFSDFQEPTYANYADYENRGGMNGLQTYYTKRAAKYQTLARIPESAINSLAYVLLDDNQSKTAIRLFKENTQNFPQSALAYNSLGDAYESLNDPKKALKAYQKAVDLAQRQSSPNTNFFKRRLKRVQKKLEE